MAITTIRSALERGLSTLGGPVVHGLSELGALTHMAIETAGWVWRSVVRRQVRFGRLALYGQIVRLGARAMGVIVLVNACIGVILALQMAPPLREFGQVETIPNIIGVAVVRELGPLISAIVLTGFAGAAIAAELGTMVVGEEIEALQAHALNPVRFLVMPRLIATFVSMLVLCVVGEVVALCSGWWIGVAILDIPSGVYWSNTMDQVDLNDLATGLFKGGVFGVIIGLLACHQGLNVRGGAEGVGQATTHTVVYSIVAIVAADLMFTGMFYSLGLT